jgi:hypothetical protein
VTLSWETIWQTIIEYLACQKGAMNRDFSWFSCLSVYKDVFKISFLKQHFFTFIFNNGNIY